MAVIAAYEWIYLFGENLGWILGISGYGNTELIVTDSVDRNAQFVKYAGG